jgi:vacuolar-type H+-ATPase subunit I/STV1
LISSAKTYQEHTQAIQKSRREFVEQMAALSEDTPLYDYVGQKLDGEAIDALKSLQKQPSSVAASKSISASVAHILKDNSFRNETDCVSLYALLHTCGATQAKIANQEYQSLVIDYITDWDRIMTDKVDTMLKEVQELESNRRHYERKVENLRQKYNDMESKGKKSPQGQIDKLERNEEKLKEAFTVHEREAGKLCSLLEAVTHDGYKELYTLVKNFMKWELNTVSRESEISTVLATTLDVMTAKCGISAQKKNKTNNKDKENEKQESASSSSSGDRQTKEQK